MRSYSLGACSQGAVTTFQPQVGNLILCMSLRLLADNGAWHA